MPYGDRIYQRRAKDAAFAAFEGGTDSTLLVLPTGTGKTILSAMMIEEFHATTGRRTLFLAHRETLIKQAFDKFTAYGLDASVEMAGQDAQTTDLMLGKSQVVIGSVPSMQGARLARWSKREFGFVIVDEAHHDDKSHQNTIGHFEDRYLLGITATPKPSLGSLFKSKCFDYPLTQAIEGDDDEDPGGWLVPPLIRKCAVSVDLKGIRTTGGDFNMGDLEERLYPHLNEVADAVHLKCEGRQTVVFTPDCGSAQALADLIHRKHGRSCEYVAGTGGKFGMPKAEKDEKLARFNKGEFQILVNCELLFEGWDCPEVKCVVICRPCTVAMLYRYIQMVGRGLRPAPHTGYFDCIVVDLDWQADDAVRDLAMQVDLWADDGIDDEVLAVARSIEKAIKADDDDPPKDAREILEEAEEIVRIKTKLQIKINPEIAKFRTMELNPINMSKLLDVKFTKRHDMDTRGNNPASPSQLSYLKSLGIDRPDGISKWGASKLLKKLTDRKGAGLATLPQVKELIGHGVNRDLATAMSADSARMSLAELTKMSATAARIQKELF